MQTILSEFLDDMKIGSDYTLSNADGMQRDEAVICTTRRDIFNKIYKGVHENAVYANALEKDEADEIEMRYNTVQKSNPIKVSCNVKMLQDKTIILVKRVGFYCCLPTGQMVLTDSLRAKAIFSKSEN